MPATDTPLSRAQALVLNLNQLDQAEGNIGKLQFSEVNGRVVVEATQQWSLKRFLINSLFHRNSCHMLYRQAHDYLQTSNTDTPLRERVVALVDKDVFPFLRSAEKIAIHNLVPSSSPMGSAPLVVDDSVEMAETSFNTARNDSDIDFDTLWRLMPENEGDNEVLHSRLATYETALRHLDDCKETLHNPDLTLTQKQKVLNQKYGLFFHFTRKDDPTTPDLASTALDSVAYMLGEINKPENAEKAREGLLALLSSKHPCHEAQIAHAQTAFNTVMLGIDMENIGPDFKDPELDKTATIETNIQKLVIEFMEESEDDSVEAFESWARERDGVIGFQAFDGEITMEVLKEYTVKARDEWDMLN
ncbi:hypothetical protein [Sansalvadorimonas verongulae]|uniref:hypothetical protein n=1 Tax=Sansalvadorimonas verongulae TaxID=2172824 RepID=UPI0012BCEE1E|nr:hypothetical protein [Sansalvadorimonas verongulae]MTI15525.1 hypothetical protein [Sansalvadorimonas verongulae]